MGQLEIEALAVHAHGDVADAGPGVEPGPERVQRAIVRGHRAPGEAERRYEESAALVDHALFDGLVRSPQHGRRDREPKQLRRPQIDDQLELGRLFDREVGGLRALEDLVYVASGAPKQIS